MPRKKSMTLAEHDAHLASDPTYAVMRRDKDAALEKRSKQLQNDAAPILDELRSLGFEIDSIWDLVNTSAPYPAAIPVLLDHLKRPYIDRNREAIARALAVPAAAYAWSTLEEQYRLAPVNSSLKNGLAIALATIAKESNINNIIDLLEDYTNGSSRILLLTGLRKFQSKLSEAALERLRKNHTLSEELNLHDDGSK